MKKRVTRPLNPKVARNAKASITPPNWARTPDAASDHLPQLAVRYAAGHRPGEEARRRSRRAIAVVIASWIDFMNALTNVLLIGEHPDGTLSSVSPPSRRRERAERSR